VKIDKKKKKNRPQHAAPPTRKKGSMPSMLKGREKAIRGSNPQEKKGESPLDLHFTKRRKFFSSSLIARGKASVFSTRKELRGRKKRGLPIPTIYPAGTHGKRERGKKEVLNITP